MLRCQARLEAMRGNFDAARRSREAGWPGGGARPRRSAAGVRSRSGEIELDRRRAGAAEAFSGRCDALERMGNQRPLVTVAVGPRRRAPRPGPPRRGRGADRADRRTGRSRTTSIRRSAGAASRRRLLARRGDFEEARADRRGKPSSSPGRSRLHRHPRTHAFRPRRGAAPGRPARRGVGGELGRRCAAVRAERRHLVGRRQGAGLLERAGLGRLRQPAAAAEPRSADPGPSSRRARAAAGR